MSINHRVDQCRNNPGGVGIVTAEIYRRLDAMAEIDDSVIIGQSWNNDVRVILFVKMADGKEVKNKDALKNPEALDFFGSIEELKS